MPSGYALRLCPPDGITSEPRVDGFGAQLASLISVYTWARHRHTTYCQTPFDKMEHRTGQTPAELFAFIGGAAYGPRANVSTARISERHAALAMLRAPAAWHPDPRRFYHEALPKPPLRWFAGGGVHVAVHVRRGDVSYKRLQGRWLSNGLVALCAMRTLDVLRATMPASSIHMHIFSQGAPADFGSLLKLPRVSLHLDEPLMDTFHHMVHADALVMAGSTLSDVAAWMGGRESSSNRGQRRRGPMRVFAHPHAEGLLKYMHRDLNITRCA